MGTDQSYMDNRLINHVSSIHTLGLEDQTEEYTNSSLGHNWDTGEEAGLRRLEQFLVEDLPNFSYDAV